MADRRLQVFYTVAKQLSFTKAADILYMTQPAVTFQVKQLEEHFNTRLFERSHGKISLTPVGDLVLGYAERILALSGELEARVGEMTGLTRLDQADEAHRELELGLSRIPGSPQLVVALAEQALSLRRFAEAHRLAESMAARTGPQIAGKRLFVARVLWAQGRSAEAVQEARAARDAAPGDAGVRLALASYCAGVGRYDEAIAAVEGAAALPSSPPGAYAARLAELRAARQAQIERRNREQILGTPPGRP